MARLKKEETGKEEMLVMDKFKGAKRNESGGMLQMVDTFKAEPAPMHKNVGYNEKLIVEKFEHCHIYHTYDSNGRPLKGTNQVGGHYHEISVYVDEQTGELKAKCSPPLQNKNSEKIIAQDQHTHQMSYIKSEKVEVRQMNALAAQYSSNFLKEDPKKLEAAKKEGYQL